MVCRLQLPKHLLVPFSPIGLPSGWCSCENWCTCPTCRPNEPVEYEPLPGPDGRPVPRPSKRRVSSCVSRCKEGLDVHRGSLLCSCGRPAIERKNAPSSS